MPNNNNDYRALEEKFQSKMFDPKYLLENTLIAHLDVPDSMLHTCECGVEYPTKKGLVAHRRSHHRSSRKTKTKRLKQKTKQLTISRNSSSKNNKSNTKNKRKKGRNFTSKRTKTIQKPSAKVALKKRRTETKTTAGKKEFMGNLTRNHNNKIVCPICNKEICKENFPRHNRVHTGDKRYKCKVCGKSFVQKGALDVHFKKHTGAKDNFCKFCSRGFYDRSALSRHERTHTGYKPYECSYRFCAKKFSDPSAFKRHIRIHTGDKIYTCDQCPKSFTDHSALFYHKKRHSNSRRHICATCGKGFYTNYYLQRHIMKSKHLPKNLNTHNMNSVHSKDKKFHCDHCGRIYKLKRCLIKHIRSKHMAIFYCHKCNSEFNLESDFRRHKAKRCAKSVLVCEICDRTLSKKSYTPHIYMHAGIAAVECHDCGKRFRSKAAIRVHIFKRHLGFPYR